MIHLMLHFNRALCGVLPGNVAWERFVAEAATVLNGKQFWAGAVAFRQTAIMTADDMRRERRVAWRAADHADGGRDVPHRPSLDWLAGKCWTIAVLRDGITGCGGRSLEQPGVTTFKGPHGSDLHQRCACWRALGFLPSPTGSICGSWVHPKDTDRHPSPAGSCWRQGAYEINGGAAWANHTDLGLTIHRP